MRGEHVRVAGRGGVKGLRGNGVEDWINRIGISRLKAGVGLKAEPGHVLGVGVVVDARGLHLLAIVAGVGNALPVRASVAIRRMAARNGAIAIERAAENRERSAGGIAVE